MKRLLPTLAALCLTLGVAGCDNPTVCDVDAGGVLPTTVSVGEGMDCAVRRLSIPRRNSLQCGSLPADFTGSRVVLEGRTGQNWRLTVDRLDGSPDAICAAVLNEMCTCVRGECTPNAAERQLILDLGIADRSSIEIVLGAGTYEVELCSRPMT